MQHLTQIMSQIERGTPINAESMLPVVRSQHLFINNPPLQILQPHAL